MQYIDENLLLLHRLHDYIYYDIQRKWAEVYEEEIRAIIAGSFQLTATPHLKEQLAPDRPLWEILALVDLYEESRDPATEARDAAVAALVAEVAPELQDCDSDLLDFCSLYPTADGTSAYVSLPTTPAQSARLVLQGLDMTSPLVLQDPIWWELTRQGSGYRLTYLTDAFERLELDFDGLHFQQQFYHAAACLTHVENPWLQLSNMAAGILEKSDTAPALLNEQETALLPMLHALYGLAELQPDADNASLFAPLLAQLQTHRLTKAEKALQALMNAPEKRREGKREKLLVCLRQAVCEPLWRQLYQAICDSQQGLPLAAGDNPDLPRKRQAVTNTLHAMGFQGEYPFFWQEGPKKGITLLRSYDQDYIVGREPYGFYMVQAFEAPILGRQDIYFTAGTVFVKKKDYVPGMRPDLFTAMFEEKGRRCFQNVMTLLSNLTPTAAATIAGKKARLEKLSKTERRSLVQFPLAGILLLALFAGLLFGVAFTLLFGAFISLILLLCGEAGAIFDFPWLFCFLLSSIGFGGCMGIIMLLQSRK